MIYFLKYFKSIAYFLAILILFQSCIAYNKNSSTIEEATSDEEMPIKITTKDGDIYKLRWVEEKDRKIISIKNVERKYYYKKDIFQYAILDPEPHTVPLDTALQHHGTIRLLTIVDNESHNSHEFIKISENDERITGYKITGKDSLTVVIPIDQIEKIQLKDKKKSNANTAGLFIGVGLGIALIVGIYAFGESFGGSWYD